jgi:hypothetical protein
MPEYGALTENSVFVLSCKTPRLYLLHILSPLQVNPSKVSPPWHRSSTLSPCNPFISPHAPHSSHGTTPPLGVGIPWFVPILLGAIGLVLLITGIACCTQSSARNKRTRAKANCLASYTPYPAPPPGIGLGEGMPLRYSREGPRADKLVGMEDYGEERPPRHGPGGHDHCTLAVTRDQGQGAQESLLSSPSAALIHNERPPAYSV